jgi:hypothetical protein
MDKELIHTAVEVVIALVGALLARTIHQMDKSVKDVAVKVDGQGEKIAILWERDSVKQAMLAEHGGRIGRLEERPSGEKRRIR